MRAAILSTIVSTLLVALPTQADSAPGCGGMAPMDTACSVSAITANGNPDLDPNWSSTFTGGIEATFDSVTGHFVRTCWDGLSIIGRVFLCDGAMNVWGSFLPGQQVTMTARVRKGPYIFPVLPSVGTWRAAISDDPTG